MCAETGTNYVGTVVQEKTWMKRWPWQRCAQMCADNSTCEVFVNNRRKCTLKKNSTKRIKAKDFIISGTRACANTSTYDELHFIQGYFFISVSIYAVGSLALTTPHPLGVPQFPRSDTAMSV